MSSWMKSMQVPRGPYTFIHSYIQILYPISFLSYDVFTMRRYRIFRYRIPVCWTNSWIDFRSFSKSVSWYEVLDPPLEAPPELLPPLLSRPVFRRRPNRIPTPLLPSFTSVEELFVSSTDYRWGKRKEKVRHGDYTVMLLFYYYYHHHHRDDILSLHIE